MVQATFGISNGEALWAVRYATEGQARSLLAAQHADSIRRMYPDNERLQRLTDADHLIVSEPFSDLPGVWREIPKSIAVMAGRDGTLQARPFRPSETA